MPATVFTDNFNRADSTSLGANWSEDNLDSSIVSNQLRVPYNGTANPGVVSTTTTAHAALQDVGCQVKRRVPGAQDGGPLVRRVAAQSFYYVDEYPTKLDLLKRVSGTDTTIQTNSFTQADNDVVRIEATGISPTTLKVFVNGTQQGSTTTDSQAALQTSGQCGVLNWFNPTSDYDDFQVDDLSASGAITLPMLGLAPTPKVSHGNWLS
jgi:hypothetical protein